MADEKRIIKGWASVEARDGEGELIPMDVLKKTMEGVKEREMPVTINHADSEDFEIVGKLVDYEFKYNDEAQAEGLWVTCEIFQDPNNPKYDEVWKGIEPNLQGEDPEKFSQFSLSGQYKLDENGTAEWIAPTSLAITQKGMNDKADIVKKEGDSMPDEKDPKDLGKEAGNEPEKGTNPDPGAEVAKPKEDPEIFDAKKAFDGLHDRLSKVENMLDSLSDEEEKEHGTDAAIEEKEEPAQKANTEDEKTPDILAQHSKELSQAKAEIKDLKMKMAKYENMGIKKTIQSGSAMPAPDRDGVTDALEKMGALDY